jgi:hypothetical protein
LILLLPLVAILVSRATSQEVVEWDLGSADGNSTSTRGDDPLFRGKTLVGQALLSRSPRERTALLEEARDHFTRLLALGLPSTSEAYLEADAFLRALREELPRSSTPPLRLSLLVVTTDLAEEQDELDEDRYRDLEKKIRRAVFDENKLKEELARARRQCSRRVTVRSRWSSRDQATLRRGLVEANEILGGWSAGALELDVSRPPLSLSSTATIGADGAGAGRILGQDTSAWSRGAGPRIEQLLARPGTAADLLLVVPKLHLDEGRFQRWPAWHIEPKQEVPPLHGYLPSLVVALRTEDTGEKKSDGRTGPPPLGRRIVEGIHAALHRTLLATSASPQRIASLFPSPAEYPRSEVEREVFLRDALSKRLPRADISALAELGRMLSSAQRPDMEMGFREILDGDIVTSYGVEPGGAIRVAFRRAVRIRSFGIVASLTGESEPSNEKSEKDEDEERDGPDPPPTVEVELEEGSALYRFVCPVRTDVIIPRCIDLPKAVDVRAIRIARPREGRGRLEIREIVLH